MKIKLRSTRIVVFFLLLLIVYALYKLIVLVGAGTALAAAGTFLLLVLIAYCLKEASYRLIITKKTRVTIASKVALSNWLQKRYRSMLFLLSGAIASALSLSLMGSVVIARSMHTRRQEITGTMGGVLGVVIVLLGMYFTMVSVKEIMFVVKKRSEILSRILEQIRDFITQPQ